MMFQTTPEIEALPAELHPARNQGTLASIVQGSANLQFG